MRDPLIVIIIIVTGYWAFLEVKGCVERHEVAQERIRCLELNSGRPTNDLTKICGGIVP
jgi:hypothetical protein